MTRNGPSPEQLEVTRALLDDANERYLAAVSKARGVSSDAVRQVLARGLVTAEQLKAAGWWTPWSTPTSSSRKLGKLLDHRVRIEDVGL